MTRLVWTRVSLGALLATAALTGTASPSYYPLTGSSKHVLLQASGTVKEITVKGNKIQSTQGILATMRTKVGAQFNQATLDLDRETLFDEGVFKAEPNIVPTQDPDGTYSILVEVVENPIVKEIRIAGNTVFTRKQLLAVVAIKTGEVLSARASNITSQKITELYVSKGYYARVIDLNYMPESAQTLNIQILEDTVSAVQITGNTRTKKRVFDHLIKTRPGEAFNRYKWNKDMQRVFNTGWFSKLDPKRDPNALPGQVALDVGVKEQRTGNFNVGVQVDPQSSFAGFGRYTETNVKGTGQSLSAGYTQGTRGGGPSVDLDYGNPFIDNRDTSFSMRLYSSVIYRFTNSIFGGVSSPTGTQQYIERHSGTSFGFSRPIHGDLVASLNFRVEGVKTDDIDKNNGNGFIQQDGKVGTAAFSLSKDLRDTTIDASKGYFIRGTVEPGFSQIDKVGGLIANQSYIGSSGFVKLSAEYRAYFSGGPPRPLDELDAPRKVLALRVRAGTIVGPIPFFEQYFAGGADTVRGYDEDRYWGKNTLLTTIEYRYPIQKAFSLIAFADYGGAWGGYGSVNTFSQANGFNMHLGYGLGIAFKTPLGLIRLDLGVNQHGGTRTHFQIGPSF